MAPDGSAVGLPESPVAAALPLATSLLVTSTVLTFSSVFPLHPSLSWPQLVALTLLYLSISAAVHSSVVWGVCRLFREHIQQPTWELAIRSWVSVAWVPLLVLLDKEKSLWSCVVFPLMVGYAHRIIKPKVRWGTSEADAIERECPTHRLFYSEEGPPLWRVLLPVAVTVLATQAGV